MVVRISDKTQNYSKVTKLLVKPINLLGKQDVEDHIMRIQSKEIASELMEMTFGNSLYNYLNNF